MAVDGLTVDCGLWAGTGTGTGTGSGSGTDDESGGAGVVVGGGPGEVAERVREVFERSGQGGERAARKKREEAAVVRAAAQREWQYSFKDGPLLATVGHWGAERAKARARARVSQSQSKSDARVLQQGKQERTRYSKP